MRSEGLSGGSSTRLGAMRRGLAQLLLGRGGGKEGGSKGRNGGRKFSGEMLPLTALPRRQHVGGDKETEV